MKKYLLCFLVLAMLLSMVACDGAGQGGGDTAEPTDTVPDTDPTPTEEPTQEKVELKYTTKKLNSETKGIRVIGERYLASEDQINCDWSCSGIEFTVDCNGGDIKLSVTTEGGSAMFRAYMDGKAWKKTDGTDYYTVSGTGTIKLSRVPAGLHTIRIIKVTGYTLARAAFTKLNFSGTLSTTAPAANEKYIEFVGDSIGCAWGTIGQHKGDYTDQDGTLAYTYLLADALKADYSMTALSGQGLLCGTPGMTVGYKYASPLRSRSEEYAFTRKADLVVINIGTNDDYQKNEANITPAKFKEAYKTFIEYVRQKNGADCKILCLYNCMNDGYSTQIKEVCSELGGSAAGIECVQLARANGNQHPTIAEHQGYFNTLKTTVENLLK